MSHQNSSGAGEPETLNLLPIYTLDNSPHKDHDGFVLKLREKNGWSWDILYCPECEEKYVLHFKL